MNDDTYDGPVGPIIDEKLEEELEKKEEPTNVIPFPTRKKPVRINGVELEYPY